MDLKLKGKVAMVAASSKGLGYGIAQALAQEGASISIGSRTQKILKRPQNNSGKKPEYQFWLRYWIHLSQNQFDNGQMPH